MTSQPQPTNPSMSSQEPVPELVAESAAVINISERLTSIEAQIPHLATKENFRHLDGKIEALRSDMTGEIQTLRSDMDGAHKELRGEIQTLRADMTGKIQSMDTKIDAVSSKMQALIMWYSFISASLVIAALTFITQLQ